MARFVCLFLAVSAAGAITAAAQPRDAVVLSQAPVVGVPAIDPGGLPQASLDLWLWSGGSVRSLTNYSSTGAASAVTSYALSADGSAAAYILSGSYGQTGEIHTIDLTSGVDRLLASNSQGCPQPLAVCPACFFPCVHDVHIAADGRILYLVSGGPPFDLVDSRGVVTSLPVYSGSLATGPRRVISDTGVMVFASSQLSSQTPGGAVDIYVMNLDGTGARNLTQFSGSGDFAQNAVISADGRTIAFESNHGTADPDTTEIFLVNADGTDLRQVTDGNPATNASLSADGSLVAFVQSGQIQIVPTSGNSQPATLTGFRYSTAQNAMIGDDGGEVAFNIGPGGARGAVYVVPAGGGASTAVYAPAALNAGGMVDVTGWQQPSPGSLVSIYGLNFSADQSFLADRFPLPPALGGISILLNGEALPMQAVTPWQVNAQLPQSIPVGNIALQLVVNGAAANSITAETVATAPSPFAFSATDPQDGFAYWQAAAFHAGTAVLADAAHPAAAGETLETYGCGLGVTSPQVPGGEPSPASPPAAAVVTPQAQIALAPARVTFAGLVPGLAGIYQVNVVVPDGLSAGLQPFGWSPYSTGASIYVK